MITFLLELINSRKVQFYETTPHMNTMTARLNLVNPAVTFEEPR